MADGIISKIQLPDNTIYDVVDNTSGYMTGMTILSYGSSTWQNFIDAYSDNKVVYCRASSNANPATGSQTRLAFMAYVNNATTPTEVEFQYYRSVSSHTASQQGDQVYVYKLNKTNGWSVTVREASVKVVAGTGLGGTYSNGTMTLTGPTKVSDLTNDSGFITGYTETDPIFTASAAYGITSSDITNWGGKQAALVSGTNIKTINNESLLGSGDITVSAEDEIFVCEYGVTTFAEAEEAYNDGKLLICYKDNLVYYLTFMDPLGIATFARSVGPSWETVHLVDDDTWTILDVSPTSTPYTNYTAKFDSSAHMNSTDMTSQEVSDFVDDLSYESEVATVISDMTDYVVAQGTSGDSTYRKWNSGIAECWLKTTQNVALNNAYGSLYQGTWSWYFPFTFTSVPVVTCSKFVWGTGASWGQTGNIVEDHASLRGIDVVSRASGSCVIQAYAIGSWK